MHCTSLLQNTDSRSGFKKHSSGPGVHPASCSPHSAPEHRSRRWLTWWATRRPACTHCHRSDRQPCATACRATAPPQRAARPADEALPSWYKHAGLIDPSLLQAPDLTPQAACRHRLAAAGGTLTYRQRREPYAAQSWLQHWRWAALRMPWSPSCRPQVRQRFWQLCVVLSEAHSCQCSEPAAAGQARGARWQKRRPSSSSSDGRPRARSGRSCSEPGKSSRYVSSDAQREPAGHLLTRSNGAGARQAHAERQAVCDAVWRGRGGHHRACGPHRRPGGR